jgi:hypothetical protein
MFGVAKYVGQFIQIALVHPVPACERVLEIVKPETLPYRANCKTVSKLLSTLWRSPLAPSSGGKVLSSPKTAGYSLNSAVSSRGIVR